MTAVATDTKLFEELTNKWTFIPGTMTSTTFYCGLLFASAKAAINRGLYCIFRYCALIGALLGGALAKLVLQARLGTAAPAHTLTSMWVSAPPPCSTRCHRLLRPHYACLCADALCMSEAAARHTLGCQLTH